MDLILTMISRRGIRILSTLIVLFTVCPRVLPAPIRQVVLAWTASSDAAANPSLTYNVYRLTGACPATPSGFTKLNSTATLTYTDSTVSLGTYCYFVTASVSGLESVPSNMKSAAIPPAAPVLGSATVTVQ